MGHPVVDWSGWENRQLQMQIQIQGSFPFASLKGQNDDVKQTGSKDDLLLRVRLLLLLLSSALEFLVNLLGSPNAVW